MKTLLLDLETFPNLAWTWGLWKVDVPLVMLEKPGGVLGFSAKWYGDKAKPEFFGLNEFDSPVIAEGLYELLDECDAVVHFNGKSFDIPWVNSQILLHTDLGPPSPYHQIDLCNVVKKTFRFPSNKLQYVSTVLGFAGKEDTGGFGLWKQVMQGTCYPFENEPLDVRAWAKMGSYCNGDVTKLDEIYPELLPWIPNHPNYRLYTTDEAACPRCGSVSGLQKRGFRTTKVSVFQRVWCPKCKAWSSHGKRARGSEVS